MPFAGKISHAFFDKTGTITTDQLIVRGVISGQGEGGGVRKLQPVTDLSGPMACVIGGCHSLLQVAADCLRAGSCT